MTNHITHRGILTFDVSDHLPTFCCLSLSPVKKLNKIKVRDLKKFDRTKFLDDVDELVIKINSHYMRDNDFNPETILEIFLNSFFEVVNLHAPVRTLTRKELHLSTKPLISKSVLKSTQKKNAVFRHSYKKNDKVLIKKYKKYFSILTSIKRLVKQNYFTTLIETNKKNISKQWELINHVL